MSNEAQQGLDKIQTQQNDIMELTDNVDEICEDQKFTLALTLFTSMIVRNE